MINKIKLTTFFVSLSIIVFGQDFSKEKTENHIKVEGTNISMIPPASFEVSGNFKGFQNPIDKTSMIIIMEIPYFIHNIIYNIVIERSAYSLME